MEKTCTCPKLNEHTFQASPSCPLHAPMTRLGAVTDDFTNHINCSFRCSDGSGNPITEHYPGCPFYLDK